MEVVSFTRVSLPFGWLGNMSAYPIEFNGKTWRTSEALFQALRFTDEDIQELIRAEKSPMSAKAIMNENQEHIKVKKHGPKDVMNMKMCLKLKLNQHQELIKELIDTGDAMIVEDVTKRGNIGGNLFWGAMLVDGEWVGENKLGQLWMDLREVYKQKNTL